MFSPIKNYFLQYLQPMLIFLHNLYNNFLSLTSIFIAVRFIRNGDFYGAMRSKLFWTGIYSKKKKNNLNDIKISVYSYVGMFYAIFSSTHSFRRATVSGLQIFKFRRRAASSGFHFFFA